LKVSEEKKRKEKKEKEEERMNPYQPASRVY